MDHTGLPDRLGDGCNGVVLGTPLLVRTGGVRRVDCYNDRGDAGNRNAVIRRDQGRASVDCPHEGGQGDREEKRATHQPILTRHRDAVKLPGEVGALASCVRLVNRAFCHARMRLVPVRSTAPPPA